MADDDAAPNRRTRYFLKLFQGISEREHGQYEGDAIDSRLVRTVQPLLNDGIETPPENTEIDVWLESPGGFAHPAYKLILDLRSRSSVLRAVVPDCAKSAATLLVVGMDEIYMSPSAELGPLDVQLSHPERENVQVSGLDISNSFSFLVTTAIDLVLSGGGSILQATKLSRRDVLRETTEFVSEFLRPTVEKLDPHLIHQARQELRVAEAYGARLLSNRAKTVKPRLSANEINRLMAHLINDYPTHGFVISRDEAKSLMLPVFEMESYPWRCDIQRHYEQFGKSRLTCVELFSERELIEERRALAKEIQTKEDPNAPEGQSQKEGE